MLGDGCARDELTFVNENYQLKEPRMNLDMTQIVLAVVGGAATVLSWLYRQILGDVKELKVGLKEAEIDAAKLREEIPTKYAQLGSMERMFEKLDTKMDRMLDKLDTKADKP